MAFFMKKMKETADDLLEGISDKIDDLKSGCNGKFPLPHEDKNKAARTAALNEQAEAYKWFQHTDKLFPHVHDIPAPEKTFESRWNTLRIGADSAHAFVQMKLNDAIADFGKKTNAGEAPPFQDWMDLFDGAAVPRPSNLANGRWKTDKEFAWNRINGINPGIVRRVTMPPESFAATDEALSGLLPLGESLRSLGASNRLYVSCLGFLKDFRMKADRMPGGIAPIALLYLDASGDPMPLAIQLKQTAGPDSPLFTPKDDAGVWLAAKMFYAMCEFQYHELLSHLHDTHLVMEGIYTAMRRSLAPTHPLSAFLEEHFFFTIFINNEARVDLIGPEGVVTELSTMSYESLYGMLQARCKDFDFGTWNVPADFFNRGMGAETRGQTPKFLQRNDALDLWAVMHEYVKKVVHAAYHTDKHVEEDPELQHWIRVITGPLGNDSLGIRGIPGVAKHGAAMRTQKDLTLFLTSIIYAVSAGHAQVNNGQWEQYGFVPFSPAYLTISYERLISKQPIAIRELEQFLPNERDTFRTALTVHLLSTETRDPLGSYHGEFFEQPQIKPIVAEFKQNLAKLSKKIDDRNDDPRIHAPYPWLNPKQIAQGISI